MLLIDADDHRLRYRRREGGRIVAEGAIVHRGVDPADWQAKLAMAAAAPARVVVASAGGAPLAARLAAAVGRLWGVAAEYPVAGAAAFGLRNGHVDPSSLPINRWLGLLAAWRVAGDGLVVVNAGTVLTADLVDASGQHRGGCVMPGARLMREALHSQTSGIAAAALLDPAAIVDGLGVNTAGAVEQGAQLALAALAERAAAALEAATGRSVRLFVTGAGMEEIIPLLRRAVEPAPDLVLDGLELLTAMETA